jgi:hypothetical protein
MALVYIIKAKKSSANSVESYISEKKSELKGSIDSKILDMEAYSEAKAI